MTSTGIDKIVVVFDVLKGDQLVSIKLWINRLINCLSTDHAFVLNESWTLSIKIFKEKSIILLHFREIFYIF